MDSHSLEDPMELIYDRRLRGALVISVAVGQRAHIHGGCWLAVAGLAPARLMAAIPKEFAAAAMIAEAGGFTVAVASRDDATWQDRFYHGDLAVVNDPALFARSPAGAPVPALAVGYVDFKLVASAELGDFLLVVGEAVTGALLNPDAENLTVNEIVLQHDPRGAEETVLPFDAFPYQAGGLAEARSEKEPLTDLAFLNIFSRRQWGIYLAATVAGGIGHLMVSGWGMQASHQPPSLVLAARADSPVVALWRRPDASMLVSLLSERDRPLLSALADGTVADAIGGLQPTDGGLYQCKRAVATFGGRASILIEQGDLVIAKLVIDQAEDKREVEANLRAEEVEETLGQSGHLDPGLTYAVLGGN